MHYCIYLITKTLPNEDEDCTQVIVLKDEDELVFSENVEVRNGGNT